MDPSGHGRPARQCGDTACLNQGQGRTSGVPVSTVPGVLSAPWEARVGGLAGRRCSPFTAVLIPVSPGPRRPRPWVSPWWLQDFSITPSSLSSHPVRTDCLLSGLVLDRMTMGLGSAASWNQRDRVTSVSNRKKTGAFPGERWPAAPRGRARELPLRGSARLDRRPRPRGPRADPCAVGEAGRSAQPTGTALFRSSVGTVFVSWTLPPWVSGSPRQAPR